MKNNIMKKVSSIIMVAFLTMPCITIATNFMELPIAYAAEGGNFSIQPYSVTTVGNFGFSYTTDGGSVDGSTNGKYYRLSAGDKVQLKVESISGASQSKPITFKFRYKDSGYVITSFSEKIYKTGTYKLGTLVNTASYYIHASGGGTTKNISASGKVQCY